MDGYTKYWVVRIFLVLPIETYSLRLYSAECVELDLSHLRAKGVGYARHRNLPKRGVECVPYRPRWYRR
jgi:hypothetical protein